MEAYTKTEFSLRVNNAEVETFRKIIGLAVERLQTSRVHQLSGTPHKKQAGINGIDLINVKNMITELAKELDLGEPTLEPSEPSDDPLDAMLLALLATSPIKPGPFFRFPN